MCPLTDEHFNLSTYYVALASSKAENLKVLNDFMLLFSPFALRKYYLHFTKIKKHKDIKSSYRLS